MPDPIPAVLGAIERPKDERDFPLGAAQVPTARPSVFHPDISWFVRNYQGQTPMCGEHAGSHLKLLLDYYATTGQLKVRKNPRYGSIKLKTPSSPVYDGYAIDAGTDMRSIFKWLKNVGADDYDPLENDVTLPLTQYCDQSVVTPAMDANAATGKISNYAFGLADFDSLCQYIFQNKAVLLLIKCDDGFWGTKTPTFTNAKYGHFIVAYGYDESGVYVIDSADPEDAHAFKFIAKQYITSEFFLESGTAVNVPPSVKQALSAQQISLAQQILADIEQALGLIRKEAVQA
jgi:Peptidase_C39 like family